jgi:drug/metabolite transporter (DMT)-like permease
VWLALTVALIGLALVAEVWRGFSFEVIGLIAALGAAFALSAHYLITDRQMRQPEPRDPVSLTMWGFGFAALFWVIVQPWWTFPWTELSGTSDASLGSILGQRPLWVLSGWMIVMGTVVPFWLVVASMRHLRASQASVIGLTEPLLAIVIAWLVLAESLAFVQLVGGALILLGVVLAERSRRQR